MSKTLSGRNDLDAPKAVGPAGLLIVGACSIAAGVLHVGASQTHGEHVGLTWMLFGVGVAQLVAGIVALVLRNRLALPAVAAVNGGAFGAWLLTRFVGIGWIAGLEEAEAAQRADAVTAALAFAAVVGAVAAAIVASRDVATPALGTRLSQAAALLVVPLIAIYGMAAVGAHDHGGSNHHDEAAADEAEADLGAWQLDASFEQIDDTHQLVKKTQEVVASFTSLADAESKGFVRINGDHMLHRDRVFDDKYLDPTAIESLVIGQRENGEDYIRGGMYLMGLNETMRDVPRFGGPLMVWHTHGGFCFEPSGVISGGPESGGECPAGSVWLDDPPMVHIYNDPQLDEGVVRDEATCGTFTYMDLPFDEPVPGCGPETNDGHSGHAHG